MSMKEKRRLSSIDHGTTHFTSIYFLFVYIYIYIYFFSSNTYIIYIFLSAMLWWTKLCVCTRRMGFDHDRASTTEYVIVPCSQHFGWKSSATTDAFNLSYRHKQGGSSVPKCWSTPNFLDLINLICLWRRRGSYTVFQQAKLQCMTNCSDPVPPRAL